MLNNELEIERLRTAIRYAEEFAYYDDSYNQTGYKTLYKLETALLFAEHGGEGIQILHDEVIIDGKFIATLFNKRWRVKGKGTWYRYGKPMDLLHKLRGSADA